MRSLSLCIIADTHGFIDPRILALANASDYVVHAGDIGNAAVLEALQPRRKVIAVLGNNDVHRKWSEEDHACMDTLNWSAGIDLPGGRIELEHGHRVNPVATRHNKLRRRHPAARAIVYGHSHILVVDDTHPVWVLNPGAAGRQRTKGGPSCLLMAIKGEDWQIETRRFALHKVAF